MPEFPIDPDVAALTAALGGLTPALPALDRDRLLYEAGRRSARRPWGWPVAGVFAVLSIGLGARLATVPVPARSVEYVYVSHPVAPDRPAAAQHGDAVAADSPGGAKSLAALLPAPGAPLLRLRDQVVRFGADGLPTALPSGVARPPVEESLLGRPYGTLSDVEKLRWQRQLSRGDV
jgi:hypothetical protein